MADDNTSFDLHAGTTPTIDIQRLFKGSTNIRKHLDRIMRESGFGSLSDINYLTLKGINYLRHGQQFVQTTRDHMGFVFFTRPILNLTYDNLANADPMLHLLNPDPLSLQNYARVLLDPWGQKGFKKAGGTKRDCPLVDVHNPFIPILSNQIISLSGWKDIALNSYTSPQGVNGEQFVMMEGFYDVSDSFEMNAAFRNIVGDPISIIFQAWIYYIAGCRHLMTMNPYPEFVEQRRFDYNTGIYRFVTDHTGTYITKYAKTIAAPKTLPTGNVFNFSRDKPFNEANAELSITFTCIGAEYNEPAIIHDFNRLVATYCPALEIDYTQYNKQTQSLVVKSSEYVKLKPHEKLLGNFMAIPLINVFTMELEWWINRMYYDEYIKPIVNDKKPVKPQTTSLNNTDYQNPVEGFGQWI